MSKLAIVTGGIRGIGAAISTTLKNAGYEVIANYHTHTELAREFSKNTGIKSMAWDVSNINECHEAVTKIEIELGKSVSILINNAGITRDGMLHKMSSQSWHDVLRTTQKFIQQLQMQKSYFQLYPAKAYILQKIYQPCI
jgi:acetoacetyl-CoA reductase